MPLAGAVKASTQSYIYIYRERDRESKREM